MICIMKITMIKSAYYIIDYKERNNNKHVEKYYCTVLYCTRLADVFVILAIM
jgi:hypothetical protein